MKLPRSVNGTELAKALRIYDYKITRQKGSHIRITTALNGTHHEVVPAHKPIKPGTLSSILKSVAQHHKITLADLLAKLDL